MFLPRKPTNEQVQGLRETAREMPLSYPEVGITRGQAPANYRVDHNRIKLGEGADVFNRAVTGLKAWKHFDLGWVKLLPTGAPIVPGSVVVVMVNHVGFWSLNTCRVVYVIDDDRRKFGFAYGTLLEHAERGEERFMIEWDESDNSVWYDIVAVSQPRHWLARIGYPLTRWWQKRFARDSLQAMVREVNR